jgi:hypothetical protein
VIRGIGEAHGRGVGEAVEVNDVLRVKRLRLRAKRSSDVEGTLCRRRHALGIGDISISSRGGGGGVKDLNRVSGKNLLSVERDASAPDFYIGG